MILDMPCRGRNKQPEMNKKDAKMRTETNMRFIESFVLNNVVTMIPESVIAA